MTSNLKLQFAIAAILGVRAVGSAFASSGGSAASGTTTDEIQEVVVTATRRTENLQDVPVTIQALTAETLQQLNIETFDDYVKYLPNVSAAGKGPGQNQIYMRGLSSVAVGNQASGVTGSFPNVAVYLDDQSVQLPGRNLDVYAADMERIEVLEGPQGTLYGAGAQAGAVRYITNKPKLDKFEAGFSGNYETTAHGDPSSGTQAFLNLALIPDTLAVRGVIYSDSRGGYIHNVPGTFERSAQSAGVQYYFGGKLPPGTNSITNASLVDRTYNPAVYKGMRLSGLYQFNENWKLLIQETYQTLNTEGVFDYNPAIGDLDVQQYNQSSNSDRFTDTAWTLSGRLGALDLVYTGGYLDRHVEQTSDYTNYSNAFFGAYYQCVGGKYFASKTPGVADTPTCYSPSAIWKDNQQNTHQSHEFRVATPGDWQLRGIAGLFYEKFRVNDTDNFFYGNQEAGFTGQEPAVGAVQFDSSRRLDGDAFFDDGTRGYTQKAGFGELTYEVIPKRLTVNAGVRFYNIGTFRDGSVNSGYGCRYVIDCAPAPFSHILVLDKTDTGNTKKLNISWKVTDDAMLYTIYSEGFRPGGFNSGQGIVPKTSPLFGIYTIPQSYGSDKLKNYEVGWKTSWFDRRLQFNGAAYQENWNDVQITQLNPLLYGNLFVTTNGPNYRVRGTEETLSVKATPHLTLTAAAAWNSSEQRNNPAVIGNAGQQIALYPTGGPGSHLANAPAFQGNIRARYEFNVDTYRVFAQVAGQHQAHSQASVIVGSNYDLKEFSTYDAAFGVSKDQWEIQAYGENLTDTRAQLYTSHDDFEVRTTTNRPRTIGVRISYHILGSGS